MDKVPDPRIAWAFLSPEAKVALLRRIGDEAKRAVIEKSMLDVIRDGRPRPDLDR